MRYLLLVAILPLLLVACGANANISTLPPSCSVCPAIIPSVTPDPAPTITLTSIPAAPPSSWEFFTQESNQFIFGLVTGIFTNFLTWWLLYHYIKPSVHFSPSINKRPHVPTPQDKSSYGYWIKIENGGRRSVIDVEIMVRLRINWPSDYMSNVWDTIYVPLSERGEIVYRFPIIYPVKSKNGHRPSLRLHINNIDRFREKPYYPKEMKYKASRRKLLLEDILNLGPNPTLEIVAFGFDEFSGARKVFLSTRYTVDDIKEGVFQLDGLKVIESPEMNEEAKKLLRATKKLVR